MTEEFFTLGLFLLPGVVFHLYLNLLYGKSDRIVPSILRVLALSGVGAFCYLLFSRQNDVNLNAVSDVVAYFSCSFLGTFLVVHFGIFEKRYRVVQSFFFGLSENTQNKNKETVLAKIEYSGKLLDRDMGRLEKGYQNLSCKKQIFLYFLMYTLVFVVAVSIIFEPFFSNDITLIWRQDAYPQVFTNLIYLRQWLIDLPQTIMNNELNLYDFKIGFGDNTFFGFATFELFHIFSFLFREEQLEFFFTLLSFLRFYFVGVSFSIFCLYTGKTFCASLAGSFIYMFCGQAIVAIRHPIFITAFALLPLLLLGIEKVRRGESSTILILIVCYSISTTYYFLYMNTIAAGFFILIKEFCSEKPTNLKKMVAYILVIIRAYFIGAAMGAVAFLQTFSKFLDSTRAGGEMNVTNMLTYGDTWVRKMIFSFISPGIGVGSWLHFMFPPVIFLCVCLLFIKGKAYKQHKVALLLGLLFCYVPLLAFIITGFGNVNNRWCYIFSMVIAMIYVETSHYLLEINKKQWILLFVGIFIYCLYVLEMSAGKNIYILFSIISLLITCILIICVHKNIIKTGATTALVLTAFVILNVSVYARIYYDAEYVNGVSEYGAYGEFESEFKNLPAAQLGLIEDDSFWRGEKSYRSWTYASESRIAGFNSASAADSVSSADLLTYLKLIENASLVAENWIDGFDSRTSLGTLANVKYFVVNESEYNMVPYGYSLDEVNTNFNTDSHIFKNQYALPIGYIYSSYLSEKEFLELNPVQMQEVMMERVVVDTEAKEDDELNLLSKQIDWIMTESDGVTIESESIVVSNAGGTLTLSFQGIENSETYARVVGLFTGSNFNIKFSSSLGTKTVYVTSDTYTYSKNVENYMVNLGYSQEPLTEVTITFPTKGTFPLEAIEIHCLPMDNYQDQIEQLKIGALENVVIGGRSVTGTSTLEEDRIMCFGIPYSSGWSATVNGEKVDILRANIMYMAIPLEAGENEIELNYMPPGMLEGGIISVIGFSIFVIGLCKNRRQKNCD